MKVKDVDVCGEAACPELVEGVVPWRIAETFARTAGSTLKEARTFRIEVICVGVRPAAWVAGVAVWPGSGLGVLAVPMAGMEMEPCGAGVVVVCVCVEVSTVTDALRLVEMLPAASLAQA